MENLLFLFFLLFALSDFSGPQCLKEHVSPTSRRHMLDQDNGRQNHFILQHMQTHISMCGGMSPASLRAPGLFAAGDSLAPRQRDTIWDSARAPTKSRCLH